jgi:predicted esterase/catechol 2,3-dioxygenase-like lactoylglutathione lyase family enzyme
VATSSVLGIHHVTAIASDPQRDLDFYAGVLGLRLVKRTVNFDDPQTYHLYYGDEAGTPGSILTFFPWPGARRGRQGPGQVAVTSFAIRPGAQGFWLERFLRYGVEHSKPEKRGSGGDTEHVVAFKDHDGLLLELVAHADAEARPAWGGAPGIAVENALHGFHSVAIWVEDGAATEQVLVDTLGFREVGEDGATRRFAVGDGGPGRIVDVRSTGGFVRGTGGAGTVHHVAWNVADDAAELVVREQVIAAGLHPTPVIDRNYFHSVYFREPGGVLFELATAAPGFAIDEPPETLGERLMLPSQFEPQRAEIEAVLPEIVMPGAASLSATDAVRSAGPPDLGYRHRYVEPRRDAGAAARVTLLLLHGTGGDENDLLPLGSALLPGAGMLSPRGKVSENGAARFFRRLAEGVFDLEDLASRTDELAEFIRAAAMAYGFDATRVVAVGFSNGANIAASLLLRQPGVLRGAVLFSPMVPFEPAQPVSGPATPVFIGAGRLDPIATPAQATRLQELLHAAGANVTLHWTPGGHGIDQGELEAARGWLAGWLGVEPVERT